MSAIDELCRMLDECGVEYEGGERSLRWRDRYGIMMQAFPLANGELGMGVWSCTPEQAVEATLGRGTCHIKPWKMEHDTGFYDCMECSECGYVADVSEWSKAIYCAGCGRKVVVE